MAELDIPITVTGLQGRPIATTAPADGQALTWSAANTIWQPVTPPFLPLSGGSLTGNLTVGGTLNVAGLTTVAALQASGNAGVGGIVPLSNGATSTTFGQAALNVQGSIITNASLTVGAAPASPTNPNSYFNGLVQFNEEVLVPANIQCNQYQNQNGVNVITGKTWGYATSNGNSTASSTSIMMGGNCTFQPRVSGLCLVVVTGVFAFNAIGPWCYIGLQYGTGSPPSYNSALTGTNINGNSYQQNPNNAGATSAFALNALLAGLTLGTTYWVDLAFSNAAGGGAIVTLSGVSINVVEL
jgi:hypothetical protein